MSARTIHVNIFSSGKKVTYLGQRRQIDHVVLSSGRLLVHLQGVDRPVLAERIEIAPTTFVLPEPGRRF